ncbi:MAG: hypothetical protein NTU65_07130 [Cyanobacteria bacterium]|nr:hypothetical protein [Cyanobacteriota bacterium]
MSSQPSPIPSSADLARYLEQRGELGKPWMWHLLRLSKLKEAKDSSWSPCPAPPKTDEPYGGWGRGEPTRS